MIEVFLSLFILAAAWFWSTSLKAREIALGAVKRQCRILDLQLLDDCVALTGLWPKRGASGKVEAWRRYAFEFSASGADRYSGSIVMLGSRVERIEFEPQKIPNDNVINLNRTADE